MQSTPSLAAAELDLLAFFGVSERLLSGVLGEALGRGGDFADLYFQHRRSTSISLEDGVIDHASTVVDRGVGVRVVIGDQTGYAFSEDLDERSMRQAARTAASIAAGAERVPPQAFVSRRFHDLYALALPWEDVDVLSQLPLVRRAEAAARELEPSLTKVAVRWSNLDDRVLLVTSDGHVQTDRRPMSLLGLSLTAERDGERQSGGSSLAGRHGLQHYTPERIQGLVQDAVARTLILFDARRPPAGEMPVVLAAGASGILLHEAIGHGMEADFNRKGTSIYSQSIGRKVAEECVTIVDSALHPAERGALNFDDEGNRTERTVLVQDGTLQTYLHDRISAKHYGVEPTGSGRRESFRCAPMPRMRCTYMENGPHTREEIIASVKRGIVAETFLNGQVQIGAGDFTFFVKNGWLIEDGKVTAPIKDVNIIGNGPEALKGVTMVANDLELDSGGWTCGKEGQSVPVSQGLPTVLVSRLTVGGENA
jgi:TldD protein